MAHKRFATKRKPFHPLHESVQRLGRKGSRTTQIHYRLTTTASAGAKYAPRPLTRAKRPYLLGMILSAGSSEVSRSRFTIRLPPSRTLCKQIAFIMYPHQSLYEKRQ